MIKIDVYLKITMNECNFIRNVIEKNVYFKTEKKNVGVSITLRLRLFSEIFSKVLIKVTKMEVVIRFPSIFKVGFMYGYYMHILAH